jgi:magnesium-transporting ATPase (P-type)
VAWLSLPASHLEKYMVAWIYSFLLFMIIYTLTFYVALLFAVNLQHIHNHHIVILNIFEKQILQMYLVFAFLHAIAFFGAVCFEKLHFIKTAFVFFIVLAVLIVINQGLLNALLGRTIDSSLPFGYTRFGDAGQAVDIKISSQDSPYLLYLIIVLTFIFWVATYFRLKEKQV